MQWQAYFYIFLYSITINYRHTCTRFPGKKNQKPELQLKQILKKKVIINL